MTYYTEVRLVGVPHVVVLVEKWQLSSQHADPMIFELQERFTIPAMLVAQDDASWMGVRAYAQMDPATYLNALLAMEDIEWCELPPASEPALPF